MKRYFEIGISLEACIYMLALLYLVESRVSAEEGVRDGLAKVGNVGA